MIFFDNAATTLKKPKGVTEAMIHAMTEFGNSGRGVYQDSLMASRVIYETRLKLCHLFNGESGKQIAFTSNATESLNIAINGIFTKGDHVITTVAEHNSVLRPLYRLSEEGVTLTIIPTDALGRVNYQLMEEAITKDTRAIIITHGSNLTGNIMDLEKVGSLTSQHELLFIVDGAQTAGLLPIDVQKLGIDILCFTGHKGLLGPQGTGGIYLRKGLAVKPLKVGGTGIDTYNRQHPDQMPTALEAGTLNGHGIAGLGAGLSFIESKGQQYLHQKSLERMWEFYEGVKKIEGIQIYGDFSTSLRCPIVTLNVGSEDSSEISDELATEYGIATRSGGHCAPLMHQALGTVEQGAVRFSFSHDTTSQEIREGINAMKKIVKSRRKSEQ